MKRLAFAIPLAAALLSLSGAELSDYEKYIEQYSPTAVSEMRRTGVPASITLAQGLIESGAGRSRMATVANNHFGIKCHNDWRGRRYYQDDDAKNECFRHYKNASESFKDHSDFLRYRDRYRFLFDLKPTDYKGWARGLKKAGYATDPKYADKLIATIEKYDLTRFDTNRPKDLSSPDTEPEPIAVPPSPSRIESEDNVEFDSEEFSVGLSRKLFKTNGAVYITGAEGDTYGSLARANDLFTSEILKFNDLDSDGAVPAGAKVYLQPKKQKAAKGLDKYIVEANGESLHDISQRFGVKLAALVKINGLQKSSTLGEGDTVLLR
ncbi:MAG: glucosaminidase domain-containing protein [Bacteroidales bacterium]|nr:glucosaminidase domain-containing protein [Bacteroidales bacterium]